MEEYLAACGTYDDRLPGVEKIETECNRMLNEASSFLMSPIHDTELLRREMSKSSFLTLCRTAGFRSFMQLFGKADDFGDGTIQCKPIASPMLQSCAVEGISLALHGHLLPIDVLERKDNRTSDLMQLASRNGYYLDRLWGSSRNFTMELRDSFESLFEFLVQLLQRSSWVKDRDSQCSSLLCWGIAIQPIDHNFLNRAGVFRVLQYVLDDVRSSIASLSEYKSARFGAIGDETALNCEIDHECQYFSSILYSNALQRLSQLVLRIVHSLASQVAQSPSASCSSDRSAHAKLQLPVIYAKNQQLLQPVHCLVFRYEDAPKQKN